MPALLGILILMGFLAALACSLANPAAVVSPQAAALIETLKWGVVTTVAYFMGSSQGSADKTRLLAPGGGPPVPEPPP
jgi:hypothetical protein